MQNNFQKRTGVQRDSSTITDVPAATISLGGDVMLSVSRDKSVSADSDPIATGTDVIRFPVVWG